MSAENKKIVDFDAMLEIDNNTTLYGFANFGTNSLDDKSWCLLKEVISGNTTTRKWSNGSKAKNVAFSNYENIDFKFLL